MLIGYARISTTDQTLALQKDALNAAGCDRIFTDTASGSRTDRPGLAEALTYVRAGDTLVVWRLDRLGRSLAHLIETVRKLQVRGVQFRSLQEQLDTATSGGKLIFHVFGALAEFERDLIRGRTMAPRERVAGRAVGGGSWVQRSSGSCVPWPPIRPNRYVASAIRLASLKRLFTATSTPDDIRGADSDGGRDRACLRVRLRCAGCDPPLRRSFVCRRGFACAATGGSTGVKRELALLGSGIPNAAASTSREKAEASRGRRTTNELWR